jgi:hypothetical protein
MSDYSERPACFCSGLRIIRDHVSSTVNTLFLAYIGASLQLMLLFVLSAQSPLFVANREFVATEIVRALVGQHRPCGLHAPSDMARRLLPFVTGRQAPRSIGADKRARGSA